MANGNIEVGMMVKIEERSVDITTTVQTHLGVRVYNRTKNVRSGHFLFGEVTGLYETQREVRGVVFKEGKPVLDKGGNPKTQVKEPAKYLALIRWAGKKYRTSFLPTERLITR